MVVVQPVQSDLQQLSISKAFVKIFQIILIDLQAYSQLCATQIRLHVQTLTPLGVVKCS